MKSPQPHIIGVHLLNDFSGSPKVFKQALQNLGKAGFNVTLMTNQGKGFLSQLPEIEMKRFSYNRSNHRLLTLLAYFYTQMVLFFRMLTYARTDVTIYVNTLLPFGAALAGWLTRKPVIYHLHEVSITPRIFMRFLSWVMHISATKVIAVSDFLAGQAEVREEKLTRIYNSLDSDFLEKSKGSHSVQLPERPMILMLCSLREYKGIEPFVAMASVLPHYDFELVLNASPREINRYFEDRALPDNLTLFPAQENVHPFYRQASMVCNLSLPDQWVETFGLTAAEAMAYGLPVIVPPVGGIAEVVEDGKQGAHINAYHLADLIQYVEEMMNDRERYAQYSQACLVRSLDFYPDRFEQAIVAEFAQMSLSKVDMKWDSISQFGISAPQ